MTHKTCSKHGGNPLPLSEFNRDSKNQDGYRNYCRACQRDMDMARRNDMDVEFESIVRRDFDPDFEIPKEELWGDGKAKLVESSTTEPWETVLFISDVHAPYHDSELITSTIELAKDLQPHTVVFNGDLEDFFMLSRFNTSQDRMDLLQDEINVSKSIRRAVREAVPNAIFRETLGNHGERLITYPAFNARALKSLDALKPSTLLGLDELEITLHPRNGFLLRPDFLVEHGHTIRKDSGATAKARALSTLISGIMGHTHRLDSFRQSGYRKVWWAEQGCLCQTSPDYVISETNWQPGIAFGTFSTRTDNFQVDLIPAVGRGFIYGGRHYGNTSVTYNLDTLAVPSYNYEFHPVPVAGVHILH